ncbi:hypothetical protein C1H46_021559 [Malus baccata]|uniref:Miro domain-containing protein n=1 Tax=Malus baccata TaxID=106549 RepID=A0A540M212_MALBA|nr:hypothetical protein C1H46_021559 [Malus baccata]
MSALMYTGKRTGVRVVVSGERGTGKSTLIAAVATDAFDPAVPPVLPPTRLAADMFPDHMPGCHTPNVKDSVFLLYNTFDRDSVASYMFPWSEAPYEDAAETTASGNLPLNAFLSEWALMTLIDPKQSLANLIYVGFNGSPASAIHVTRRRAVDRKKQKTERNVFNCFVFGPKNAGKSALLNSFIGRPFSKSETIPTGERYAVNVINQIGGNKTLVLREIPEDEVKTHLSDKTFLAACDVAVFVHASSSEHSWKRSRELLVEVAKQGEESGFGVPCLLVAAKDDLGAYPMAVRDSVAISHELGIEAPVRVSMKLSTMNDVFYKIVNVAEHPHLSIPETEARRNRKKYLQVVNQSLLCVSVGAAIAVVGLAAYRAYAARRNASG